MSKAFKIRRSTLAKLTLTRNRQKAWREKPELMESIRLKATAKAEAVKEGRHRSFVSYLSDLPKEFTVEELNTLMLNDWLDFWQVTRQSFFIRVKRRGLLSYDHARGLWINLTKD